MSWLNTGWHHSLFRRIKEKNASTSSDETDNEVPISTANGDCWVVTHSRPRAI